MDNQLREALEIVQAMYIDIEEKLQRSDEMFCNEYFEARALKTILKHFSSEIEITGVLDETLVYEPLKKILEEC